VIAVNNSLILLAIAALLIVSFIIGIKSKQTNSASSFIGSSKSFGSVVVALSGTAAIASGWMIVGFPALIFKSGNFMTTNALMAGAFAISYIFIGKKIRAIAEVKDVATIGDLIEARYGEKRIKLLSSLVLFLGCFSYLAAQIAAGASLFTYLFGWDVFPSAVLIFGVVIVYVAVGGESAGIMSQAFQGAIMVVVGAVVIGIFFKDGGFFAMTNGVISTPTVAGTNGITSEFKPIILSAFGTASQSQAVTYFTLAWIGTVCQPAIITRMFALKNPRDLPRLAIQTGITQAVVSFFGITLGYLAILLVVTGKLQPIANVSETTWVIGSYLGFGMQILLYTAASAAIISSASMYLSIGASAISKDVLDCLGVKMDDQRQIFIARIAIVIVGLGSILIASFSGETVALLGVLGWATFMTIFVPLILVGMIWKRANAKGMGAAAFTALVGNIIGMLLLGFSDITWPHGLPWYMYLITLSTSVGIIVSYVTYDERKDAPEASIVEALKI
jgi:Na+/proline symporter